MEIEKKAVAAKKAELEVKEENLKRKEERAHNLQVIHKEST